jgi:DNA mismatch repair protein MutS
MDEIGRGTSTYDGLALAWSCAEELAGRIGAYTLFATHYFELTELETLLDGVANVRLDAVEHGDRIVFMHAVKDGAADRSYGLQVAALAGLPQAVLQRARLRLEELESRAPAPAAHRQLPLFSQRDALRDALAALDPDSLSPREALDALYRLRALL